MGEVRWDWSNFFVHLFFVSIFSQSQLVGCLRMVDGALHLVEPWEGGSPELWDLALECKAWSLGIPRWEVGK